MGPPSISDRPPSPFPGHAKSANKDGRNAHHARFNVTNVEQSNKLAVPAPTQSLDPTAVLKQREKISVAKEKRAAKTIAVMDTSSYSI